MKNTDNIETEEYIKYLEEELALYIQRIKRKQASHPVAISDRIKHMGGLTGKILRAPRSVFRIILHPKTAKDILKKYTKKNRTVENETIKSQNIHLPQPVDPIKTINVDHGPKRINLVTDSLAPDSLFGGVATALIVATEFANTYDYELRIITRNTEFDPLSYFNVIEVHNVVPARKISFYSDYDRMQNPDIMKLEIGPNDVFMATSWWSAQAISETTKNNFFYIIQEVETFFYEYSSARLACEKIMQSNRIKYIVNSHYLYDYFQKNEPNITKNGCFFEPAFPEKNYQKSKHRKQEQCKLFFYARPNHPRNLYTYGVRMIELALQRGILDPKKWTIYFAGAGSQTVEFSNGTKCVNLGSLPWNKYFEFLSQVDLGISLMYTPHPSYPPYDIANSGGVVLSNKMLNKTEFKECKNVILSELEERAFLKNLQNAIGLATDSKKRLENFKNSTICHDWHQSLANTIKYMGDYLDEK